METLAAAFTTEPSTVDGTAMVLAVVAPPVMSLGRSAARKKTRCSPSLQAGAWQRKTLVQSGSSQSTRPSPLSSVVLSQVSGPSIASGSASGGEASGSAASTWSGSASGGAASGGRT